MGIDKGTRLDGIDQFRGFAILLMILANFFLGVAGVPAWMKHAHGAGLTVVDLVAPFFIFAIALTYPLSWRHRLEHDGAKRAAEHFCARYLAIAGIGFILTTIWGPEEFERWKEPWGVLQAIGAAGLVTLTMISLKTLWRGLLGLAMLGAYQYLLNNYWLQEVRGASHGGIRGSLSWGAMLVLGTVLADLYHAGGGKRWLFPLAGVACIAAGAAMAPWIPISKELVSVSYDLVSLGASVLVFELFDISTTWLGFRSVLLSAWGRNPLLLYILHLFLLGVFVLPSNPRWYAEAPLWLTAIEAVVFTGVLSAIALFLKKKNWYFSL